MFTQTPRHTAQPCRFDVDYDQPDATLKEATLGTAKTLAGFTTTKEWQEAFNRRFSETE